MLRQYGMPGCTAARSTCRLIFRILNDQWDWKYQIFSISKLWEGVSQSPLPPTANIVPYLSSAQQDLTNKQQEHTRTPMISILATKSHSKNMGGRLVTFVQHYLLRVSKSGSRNLFDCGRSHPLIAVQKAVYVCSLHNGLLFDNDCRLHGCATSVILSFIYLFLKNNSQGRSFDIFYSSIGRQAGIRRKNHTSVLRRLLSALKPALA